MNLINEEITHKVFGKGSIIEQEDSVITVDFDNDIKKFVYPDAFLNFITLNNKDAAKSFQKIIAKKEQKQEALERERVEEQERLALERQRREKLKNHKTHESSQIVFWLDEEEQASAFDEWKIFTGTVQSGQNEGSPNRAPRLAPNSAALLTVRDEEQAEEERKIIGIYMVKETFFGNLCEDGMVESHEDFRIQLTDEESEKMLFWNYYINKNYPHRKTWNSGKFRYYDNEWTVQILRDLMQLKTDEEEIEKLEKFLEYFSQMNALDVDEIPEAAGALKQ